MRAIFAAIIIVAASTALVHAAEAQKHARIQPAHGYMQAPAGHRQPTKDDVTGAHQVQFDKKSIDKDNELLDLPSTQDKVLGADQVEVVERAMAWSHNAISLNADGATLALARLRRLSPSKVSRRVRTVTPKLLPNPDRGGPSMSNKVVHAGALVAALSILAGPGIAKDAPPLHQGSSPIYNGFNHQPTQDELRALHRQDVTPDQAREIDRLYDQLLSSSEKILRRHPALVR
jgi:hypothetical protein